MTNRFSIQSARFVILAQDVLAQAVAFHASFVGAGIGVEAVHIFSAFGLSAVGIVGIRTESGARVAHVSSARITVVTLCIARRASFGATWNLVEGAAGGWATNVVGT